MYSFLTTLSHADLVRILHTTFTTMGVGIAGLLAFLMFTMWEDRKQEAAEKAAEKAEKEENTFVYGTKETYVTIQHQGLNKDDGEFLRHVRALSAGENFLEVLGNFTKFLKVYEHPNYEDVADVRRILRDEELESAMLWLSTVQAFWMLHPWKKAIPYIPYDLPVDEVEYLDAVMDAAMDTAMDTAMDAAPAPPSSPVPT